MSFLKTRILRTFENNIVFKTSKNNKRKYIVSCTKFEIIIKQIRIL